MLQNYLKIALRNFRRQKGYAAINVIGLAVGMIACLLIGLYVYHEWSYDRFHENADRIVQVGAETAFWGQSLTTPFPLGRVIEADVPAAERTVQTRSLSGEKLYNEVADLELTVSLLQTSVTFFEVFSFEVLEGDPVHALDQPDGLVLTDTIARTLFGSESAIGRTLEYEGENRTVLAVVVDAPEQSTIQFDAVIPFSAEFREQYADNWGGYMFQTYALLRDPTSDRDALAEQIVHAVSQHTERELNPFVLDLPTVYLSGHLRTEGFRGELRYLYIFGSIALFTLLIAAINYINLATAQSLRRAREVGVRKAMGAERRQLARQFLLESLLLSGIAFVLALVALPVILPAFNSVFGTSIVFAFGASAPMLALLAILCLLVGLFAGTYPAFVLARFDPIRVLRHQQASGSGSGGWLRRGLVVTQFAISTALIVGTVVVYQQLHYMQSKDLGFDREQVVSVPLPETGWGIRDVIVQEVAGHPDIALASFATAMPGRHGIRVGRVPEELSTQHRAPDEEESIPFAAAVVSPDYVQLLGLNVIAGRAFDRDRPSDLERAIILNETGAQRMGWAPEEAIGKPFSLDDVEGEVIGIVEDYHIAALHSEIEPVALQVRRSERWASSPMLLARLRPEGIRSSLDHIEATLSSMVGIRSFEYQFIDEVFHAAYQAEVRLSRIFSAFAFVAIFIACLGLVGLAAYSAQRRTKEIGIRKVLGATTGHIVALLSREYAVLVVLAVLIGAPVAYVAMQHWLEDFAYRITIGPTTFAVTAALALAIAFASVGYHAIRAALTDPARSLRYE